MSGVSKERVTLWSGCIGQKALAGFLGQRPKPLGRAHNFGAQRRSYSGLYLGKPSQSRHVNRVPLKSCAVRPSVPPGYVGSSTPSIVPSCASFGLFTGLLPCCPLPLSPAWVLSVSSSASTLLSDLSETTGEHREEERAAAPPVMLSASCLGHWQPSGTVHGLCSNGVSLESGVRTPSACPLETAAGLT